MSQDNRRQMSNFFINQSLQFRLIFISIGYMILMLIIIFSFTLLPIFQTMLEATDPYKQYQSAQTFLLLAQRLVPAVLLLFFFFFIHLIVLTHRICGPLVNFSHTFECMAGGDFSRRITLRKKDYLHHESELINQTLDNLQDHIRAIGEENRALAKNLSQMPPTAEALIEAKKRSENLTHLIDAFHS